MKRILILILFFICPIAWADEDLDKYFDLKQNALALYNTNHIDEAYEMLNQIPNSMRDEEFYLILSNIEEDKGNIPEAFKYLNTAIEKNPKFYKAYYNLGCLYMKKRGYSSAAEKFELAVKYEKNNPYAFYNLGCAQINLGEYKKAKRNFIKAIYLKNNEKNFYYNLAYVNKKLGKEKDAQKIIDFYNQNFVK